MSAPPGPSSPACLPASLAVGVGVGVGRRRFPPGGRSSGGISRLSGGRFVVAHPAALPFMEHLPPTRRLWSGLGEAGPRPWQPLRLLLGRSVLLPPPPDPSLGLGWGALILTLLGRGLGQALSLLWGERFRPAWS